MDIICKTHHDVIKSLFGNSFEFNICITLKTHVSNFEIDAKYRKSFAKTLHKHKHIIYIPYRNYFSHIENNEMRNISQYCHNSFYVIFRIYRNYCHSNCCLIKYHEPICKLLHSNSEYYHILMCSVPEYAKCCMDAVAKYRSAIVVIYEQNCELSAENVVARRVFADEVIIATIVGFL